MLVHPRSKRTRICLPVDCTAQYGLFCTDDDRASREGGQTGGRGARVRGEAGAGGRTDIPMVAVSVTLMISPTSSIPIFDPATTCAWLGCYFYRAVVAVVARVFFCLHHSLLLATALFAHSVHHLMHHAVH